MLKTITLKNFRKHKDLTINFSDGINVVRAPNEGGKSTLFEAVLFALFGVRTCRNNDLTTWGEPAGSHRVELEFTSEGKTYKVVRIARAAEAVFDGGRITGQTDVSAFCEEVLGLKPNTGSKIMFAGQSSLRGVLDEGGAKTSQMIEQLAGFDLFDTWLETLQTEYQVGRTEPYVASLEAFKQQAENAQHELDELEHPDKVAERWKSEWQQELNDCQTGEANAEVEQEILQGRLKESEALEEQRRVVETRLASLRGEMSATERLLAEDLKQPGDTALDTYCRTEFEYNLYQDYQTLSDYQPKAFFNGSREELEQRYKEVSDRLDLLEKQQWSVRGRLKQLKNEPEQSLACSACKREWADAAEREAHNRQHQEEVSRLEAEVAERQTQIDEIAAEQSSLSSLLKFRVLEFDEPNSRWRRTNENVYPPKFEWKYDRLPEAVTRRELEAARRASEDEAAEHKVYAEKLAAREAAQTRLQALAVEQAEWETKLAALPQTESPASLREKISEVRHKSEDARRRSSVLQSKLDNFDAEIRPVYEQYGRVQSRLQEAQSEAERCKKVISEMRLNNSLVKALRGIKPTVSDKLWNSLCGTVSKYFSLMRGCDSVVGKGDNGFTVDGCDIGSLSGSTLDILGIALRVALVKTFTPQSNLLFLDEPFAACDTDRQTQVLGFLVSAGFKQVVVITHEDTSELVGSSLIEL